MPIDIGPVVEGVEEPAYRPAPITDEDRLACFDEKQLDKKLRDDWAPILAKKQKEEEAAKWAAAMRRQLSVDFGIPTIYYQTLAAVPPKPTGHFCIYCSKLLPWSFLPLCCDTCGVNNFQLSPSYNLLAELSDIFAYFAGDRHVPAGRDPDPRSAGSVRASGPSHRVVGR